MRMSALVEAQVSDRDVVARPGMKVLLADDHPLIIAGIRRTIEHLDDMEVVGEAHSGQELLQLIERRAPDLVLMDLRMPGVSGVEMLERIRQSWPKIKTVVLSACR